MAKNTKKIIVAVMLIVAILGTVAAPALALSAGETVEYPFAAKGLDVAPTYKAPTTNGDLWVLTQTTFPKVDLSAAAYIAYEFEMVSGAAGIDFGVITEGGNRFGTHSDGANKAFLVTQDGAVTGLTVQYAAITLSAGTKGMLVIPVSSLVNRNFGAGDSLANAVSFYMCFNTLYNNSFEIKIGEVGYYTGEPSNATFVKLLDLSAGEKKDNYIADAGSWTHPERAPLDLSYPFRTGEAAFVNAPTYKAPTTNGDAWAVAQVTFPKTDLSKATYIALEIQGVKGNPGIDYGIITEGGNRFGTHIDGEDKVFFMTEDGTKTGLKVQYASVNLGEGAKGMLLIPVSSLLNRNFGAGDSLANAVSFYMCFNTLYNNNFEIKIGEVGYYTGAEPSKDTFVKLLDLSEGLKKENYIADLGSWAHPEEEPADPEPADLSYPFRIENAFENAPTYIAPTTNGDQWILTQTTFPKADLSKATYIAYEIEVVKGNPGIDFGIITQGGNRFGTHIDGAEKAYFMTADGTMTPLTVQYAAINLGNGAKGMLLIPVSSLFNRNFGACDGMENAVSFYMCYNTLYNNNFEIKIGEVGYYTGAEPSKDTFVKLLDLSEGEKTASYIADGGAWELRLPVVDDTGDATPISLLLALMTVSAGAVMLLSKKNRR